MKSCLDPKFTYTPARDMGPDYLRHKFDKLRKQQASQPKAPVVAEIKPRKQA